MTAVDDLTTLSDAELRAATGGCTELSCIYHYEYVAEIRRRATTDRSNPA